MDDFYNKYHRRIRSFVAKKIDDEGVAEELTNDIMLAGINSRPNFSGKSSEFSWLCGIAKHKIIDYYRKKKLKTILFSVSPVFEEIADQALNPERDSLKNELKEEIKKTFKAVGEGYGKILRLKYVEGLAVGQIAKKLKMSVKATESRLFRARKGFSKKWKYEKKN
ncbi:RNA polymerase sigma factor [Patescibacteria group bacterium]|nr:RNA polymerase sigma factor [Patescibacteria group bacterium]